MTMSIRRIKQWPNTIEKHPLVGVSEGGLGLQEVGNEDVYIEIGGLPDEEDEIASCPKCGTPVSTADSFDDEGVGDESGRTFHYCSEHCRQTH
jgi:hypothetical protein